MSLSSHVAQENGGAMRDRTADLLRAKQALSQLSYGPNEVVGLSRLELPTSPLSGVRSNHLSYRPTSRDALFTINQAICVNTQQEWCLKVRR